MPKYNVKVIDASNGFNITKHPKIMDYTTIWIDSLRNGQSELVNTNKLLRNYQGCTGLKTGSVSMDTAPAGSVSWNS